MFTEIKQLHEKKVDRVGIRYFQKAERFYLGICLNVGGESIYFQNISFYHEVFRLSGQFIVETNYICNEDNTEIISFFTDSNDIITIGGYLVSITYPHVYYEHEPATEINYRNYTEFLDRSFSDLEVSEEDSGFRLKLYFSDTNYAIGYFYSENLKFIDAIRSYSLIEDNKIYRFEQVSKEGIVTITINNSMFIWGDESKSIDHLFINIGEYFA